MGLGEDRGLRNEDRTARGREATYPKPAGQVLGGGAKQRKGVGPLLDGVGLRSGGSCGLLSSCPPHCRPSDQCLHHAGAAQHAKLRLQAQPAAAALQQAPAGCRAWRRAAPWGPRPAPGPPPAGRSHSRCPCLGPLKCAFPLSLLPAQGFCSDTHEGPLHNTLSEKVPLTMWLSPA